MSKEEALRVIGTYEDGWVPLQPKTVERKGAETPLLETGELRDSIEYAVDKQAMVAVVGSNNPKAKWHEFGTIHIPARSFLRGAALRKEHEVTTLVGDEIAKRLFEGLDNTVGAAAPVSKQGSLWYWI